MLSHHDLPGPEDDDPTHDLSQGSSWSSPTYTSAHSRSALDQRSFEVEPPYLPTSDSAHYPLGTAEYGMYPRSGNASPGPLHRRPTWTEEAGSSGNENHTIHREDNAGQSSSGPGLVPGLGPSTEPPLYEMQDLKPSATTATTTTTQQVQQQQQQQRNAPPGEVTPYLGLRARLTQVPINRWTVLLFLVLARMLILFDRMHTDLGNARSDALSACHQIEDIGNALVSVPHYFADGLNEIVGDGVTDAVHGLVTLLTLVLTGFEETIFFMIEYYLGTVTCLVDAFVHGTLEFAQYAINDTVGLINDAVQDALKGLEDAVDNVGSALSTLSKDLSHLGVDIPSVSTIESDLEGLPSVTNINASALVGSMETVNNDIPSFDGLKDIVQDAIAVPFDLVKNLLKDSYGNWTFDTSLLDVPPGQLLTFCSDNSFIQDFFQTLSEIAAKAKIIAVVSLVLLALASAAVMAWWEIQRYNRAIQNSQRFRNREPTDISYLASRPLTASTGIWLSEKLARGNPRRQMLIRWTIAYATTYTALFVLSLAIATGLSSLCQFLVMRAVQKEAPVLTMEVGTYVGDVMAELAHASTQWANTSNSKILALQNDINDDVLGYVLQATSAVNATLFKLNGEVNATLVSIFGSMSQLEKFFYNIYGCILGDKLVELEEGIDWVHNHSQVSLPLFPTDVFSLGNNDSALSHLLTNSTASRVDDVTAAVDKVIDTLRSNIVQESIIALVLLLVYVAYVLFGATQAALRMCFPDKYGTVAGDKTLGRFGL